MSAPSQPPLWTWAVTIVIAVAATAGLLAFDAATQPGFILESLNLGRLDQPLAAGAARVVVLGTSRTKCALAYDRDMEARFRRAGRPVSFTRIAVLGGASSQTAYALDPIVRSHPALVLVESDLVTIEPGGFNAGGGPTEQPWQSRLRSKLKGLRGYHQPSPNDAGSVAPCDERDTPKPVPTLAQYKAALAKRRVSTPAEQRLYLDFMDRLRAQGAAVGLIEIPMAPEAEASLPPRLAHERAQLAERLAADHRLVHLRPATPPASEYVDRGHLNAAGRERFSGWLVTEAIEQMRGPHA